MTSVREILFYELQFIKITKSLDYVPSRTDGILTHYMTYIGLTTNETRKADLEH